MKRTRFKCKTHNVELITEGNKRTFNNPKGSYPNMPRCQLHVMPEPIKEGKVLDCEIVKEE